MAEKVRGIEAESPGDFSAIHPYVKGELYRKSFQARCVLCLLLSLA
jgi:hypothetical protein